MRVLLDNAVRVLAIHSLCHKFQQNRLRVDQAPGCAKIRFHSLRIDDEAVEDIDHLVHHEIERDGGSQGGSPAPSSCD